MKAWNNLLSSLGFGGGTSGEMFIRDAGGSSDAKKNLSNVIYPTSFQQAKTDIKSIMSALELADRAAWPFRNELQKIFEKTLKNGHVASCVERRKELTLLREFQLENPNGEKDKAWTEYFQKAWFTQKTLPFMLDAVFHGFTLVSLGGIKDSVPEFDLITPVKRWFISPERRIVSTMENGPSGYSWDAPEVRDWHLWIPTVQPNGISNCGYGLLLVTSILETMVRNNVQWNADFIEMFAQPFRLLKTDDQPGTDEYAEKKQSLTDMGHNGAMIVSLADELEFLNDGSRGNGYKAYTDFDHRHKADISKWLGGHADFIDSTPRAMDAQSRGGGDITDDATGNTQVQKAAAAKRKLDGSFCTTRINEELIPKLRNLGIPIPEGLRFKFLNDSEERAIAAQEADKNQKIGTLALTFAQAGLQMDAEYASKATGIPFTKVDIAPDNNVLTDKKEQADGKGPLKDGRKNRIDKPRFTKK